MRLLGLYYREWQSLVAQGVEFPDERPEDSISLSGQHAGVQKRSQGKVFQRKELVFSNMCQTGTSSRGDSPRDAETIDMAALRESMMLLEEMLNAKATDNVVLELVIRCKNS